MEVYAPASIANLGPGFDVFAIALNDLGDVLSLEAAPGREVSVSVRGVEAEKIPENALANSAGAVLQHAVERYGVDHGFHVSIDKGVPPGKGLGSSGASAAAAATAVIKLLGLDPSPREFVKLAAVGEAAVAGSAHADNVSASLLGGFTMVGSDYDVVRLEPPDVEFVIVIPDVFYENKTKLARSLLPDVVGLGEAVLNIGNASKMVAAVALGDPVLFGRSICDNIIEPHRAEMIPHFWEVKRAAFEAGAYGCSIAGGGPSLFAVGADTTEIGKAMTEAFQEAEVGCEVYFTRPSSMGARVI